MTHTSLKENQGTVQIKNQNVDVIDLPGDNFFSFLFLPAQYKAALPNIKCLNKC